MLIETPLGTKFIEYAEELWANLKKSKGELWFIQFIIKALIYINWMQLEIANISKEEQELRELNEQMQARAEKFNS